MLPAQTPATSSQHRTTAMLYFQSVQKTALKIKLDPSVIFCSQQFSKLLAIKQSTTAFSPLPLQTQRDNSRNRALYLANYSFQP